MRMKAREILSKIKNIVNPGSTWAEYVSGDNSYHL